MFLLKLFGRAALTLALLGATAGIIAAGGCGKYVPHEPEQPGITDPETPGEDPDEPGEDPDEPENPEGNYVDGYIQINDAFEQIAEYTGKLNAMHITERVSSGSGCILAMGPTDADLFTGGYSFKLTVETNGPVVYDWFIVSDDGSQTEQIVFENGSANITIENGAIFCNISGIDSVVFDIDLTITLERI